MKKLCPNCRTEMIERSNIYVCPRHEIGDCSYDALSLIHEMPVYQLNDVNACSDMHSYVSQDSK